MDLDQFKVVNDTCGHLAGDELLCRITALLQDSMRDTDLVARLGGDEFAVLLARCTLADAERRVGEFHPTLQQFRFTWRDKTFTVGASIGIVPITRASSAPSPTSSRPPTTPATRPRTRGATGSRSTRRTTPPSSAATAR